MKRTLALIGIVIIAATSGAGKDDCKKALEDVTQHCQAKLNKTYVDAYADGALGALDELALNFANEKAGSQYSREDILAFLVRTKATVQSNRANAPAKEK
jgi:hypothetical protein